MIIPEKNDERLRSAKKASRQGVRAAKEGKLLPAVGQPDSERRSTMAAIEGDARGELSVEHIAEIRQRISDGAYNTLEVADQVARRLLSTRDLDSPDE